MAPWASVVWSGPTNKQNGRHFSLELEHCGNNNNDNDVLMMSTMNDTTPNGPAVVMLVIDWYRMNPFG
jgi:hypothetical protein